MTEPTTPLARAEYHVRKAVAHVARQREIFAVLIDSDHTPAAERAKTGLALLEHSLQLAMQRLQLQ